MFPPFSRYLPLILCLIVVSAGGNPTDCNGLVDVSCLWTNGTVQWRLSPGSALSLYLPKVRAVPVPHLSHTPQRHSLPSPTPLQRARAGRSPVCVPPAAVATWSCTPQPARPM